MQLAMDAIRQDDEQPHPLARFADIAEQRGHSHAIRHTIANRVTKLWK
jgi:hypothetical protein